jgi:hypothetical protein
VTLVGHVYRCVLHSWLANSIISARKTFVIPFHEFKVHLCVHCGCFYNLGLLEHVSYCCVASAGEHVLPSSNEAAPVKDSMSWNSELMSHLTRGSSQSSSGPSSLRSCPDSVVLQICSFLAAGELNRFVQVSRANQNLGRNCLLWQPLFKADFGAVGERIGDPPKDTATDTAVIMPRHMSQRRASRKHHGSQLQYMPFWKRYSMSARAYAKLRTPRSDLQRHPNLLSVYIDVCLYLMPSIASPLVVLLGCLWGGGFIGESPASWSSLGEGVCVPFMMLYLAISAIITAYEQLVQHGWVMRWCGSRESRSPYFPALVETLAGSEASLTTCMRNSDLYRPCVLFAVDDFVPRSALITAYKIIVGVSVFGAVFFSYFGWLSFQWHALCILTTLLLGVVAPVMAESWVSFGAGPSRTHLLTQFFSQLPQDTLSILITIKVFMVCSGLAMVIASYHSSPVVEVPNTGVASWMWGFLTWSLQLVFWPFVWVAGLVGSGLSWTFTTIFDPPSLLQNASYALTTRLLPVAFAAATVVLLQPRLLPLVWHTVGNQEREAAIIAALVCLGGVLIYILIGRIFFTAVSTPVEDAFEVIPSLVHILQPLTTIALAPISFLSSLVGGPYVDTSDIVTAAENLVLVPWEFVAAVLRNVFVGVLDVPGCLQFLQWCSTQVVVWLFAAGVAAFAMFEDQRQGNVKVGLNVIVGIAVTTAGLVVTYLLVHLLRLLRLAGFLWSLGSKVLPWGWASGGIFLPYLSLVAGLSVYDYFQARNGAHRTSNPPLTSRNLLLLLGVCIALSIKAILVSPNPTLLSLSWSALMLAHMIFAVAACIRFVHVTVHRSTASTEKFRTLTKDHTPGPVWTGRLPLSAQPLG